MTPCDRQAYIRLMAESAKFHNQRDADRRWRFGETLSHANVDRSAVVQRLIDHNAWPAARLARAIELGQACEFSK